MHIHTKVWAIMRGRYNFKLISLNRLSAPKENSTINLEFSTCDTSYDVVNGLALLLTSDDLGRIIISSLFICTMFT